MARMAESPQPAPTSLSFLAGGGEMGARMRAMDWSRTVLGWRSAKMRGPLTLG
jgi:hypothetical protein